ncbi:ABC transporter permease subunit [Mesorhizobium sp. M2A.F.Ca.ET.037.01.1.1]|uniref:ABC transporter permease n=1 Tax=unclassified Mesorhizobium TaxID=325217 RepID=UPI000F763AD9|nr:MULTISPECIES: ABC transporter permease [unclassified Mesorhizobium]RUY11692.1 ABC transporter permease subunit [Mesorhizobium sp. M2A.F.Ca.ET.040.01.1.1]RVC69723.1 ABC transporter permease subunit [Mesorhizobium sp. M00.F.Ca.ET.038.03.1.1]AZO37083.1 ABC transporter permease [Mesorhizobium sp. M2A.F.Ca.ET.046.03.2.1]RUX15388.1 ABC transporter permease subunit [Mesorhizobium sp. M2A.F.Ca.ET.037.01.1.1]RWA92056.1 MAG: ABC transporter permease subunit [Mesorhizobium sp.]
MAEPRVMDIKDQPGFRSIAIICLLVLYVPVLILMIFSLNSGSLVTHWEGVTLGWYGSALLNEEFHAAAKNTLIISVTATIVSTICATLAAIGMTRVKPWRGLAAAFMVINLPLMVPEIITAVATLSFFALIAGAFGLNFGIGNLILAHTVFCIPFAYMPIRARLEDMDLTLEYAAADLYATPWNAFRRITLPLLVPGVMSGAALAFIVSFDDFTITQLVAGPGQTTLPLYIWNQIRRPMTPEINAISTILLMVSILFVSVSFLIARRRAK